MFIDSNNNRKEVNLIPYKKARNLRRLNLYNACMFGVIALPCLIIFFTSGMSLTVGIILGVLLALWAYVCFNDRRSELWHRIRYTLPWLVKKVWSVDEIKAYWRIKEINSNHIKYINDEKTGYISVYRINGTDLSLMEIPEQDNAINKLSELFGHRGNFDIVCANILYQIPKKNYKLKLDNSTIHWLKSQYDQTVDALNENIHNAQRTYFIILNNENIQENERVIKTLTKIAQAAKLVISAATKNELEQVLTSVWPTCTIDSGNVLKTTLKRIESHKSFLKCFYNDGTFEYMAFRSIIAPSLVNQGWLEDFMNSHDYTVYMSNKYLDTGIARGTLRRTQDAISSLMSSRWFESKATDSERSEYTNIKSELEQIGEMLADRSHIYEMREVNFYLIFKGKTKKEINNLIDGFEKNISDNQKGFEIQDLNFLQMEAFTYTRLYELPKLQFKTDYWKKIKSFFSAKKTSSKLVPLDVAKESSIHLLNTSIALGYPFTNAVSVGDVNSWYIGLGVDSRGNEMHNKPIFQNYWKVDNNHNSFSRFILAKTGGGKSWTAKGDMIRDRLDNRYIMVIDPKGEYGKFANEMGGDNVIIGSRKTKNDKQTFINLWDVLIMPNDMDSNGDEIIVSPLDRTYMLNGFIASALLGFQTRPDADMLQAAWDKVQKNVYEIKCGFDYNTDFSKIKKTQMPLTDDFYQEALKLSKNMKEDNKKAMTDLSILLERFSQKGTSGYMFNNYSNIDWTKNRMFNLDLSNIFRSSENILSSYVIGLINIAMSLMIDNKNSGYEFMLYVDETHTIRHIKGVLQRLNQFVRICRSHNGGECLIDQGLDVIRPDSTVGGLYNEIFEQTEYNIFLKSKAGDVQKLVTLLDKAGKPLSETEQNYILTAGDGAGLLMSGVNERMRIQIDATFWRDIFVRTRSEGSRIISGGK